jgi:ABC-type glucose/galactose transport system permease subunit
MKPLVLVSVVFVVAMALGVAAGLSVWQSTSLMAKVDVAIAVLFGGLLLTSMWGWYHATSDSPDRKVLSTMMMVYAALLLGLMPRIVWPDGGWKRTAASILALCASTGILIWQLRERRRRRVT